MIKIQNKQQPTLQLSTRLEIKEHEELKQFREEYGVTIKKILWEGMNAIKAVYPKKNIVENSIKNVVENVVDNSMNRVEENNSTNNSVKPIDNP